MLDRIFNEDCLVGMQRIPDGSIDCIITDLPFGVLHKDNENVLWDRIIPFDKLWEQFLRVTKEDAAIILFCQGMFTAQLMMSQPKLWRYNLIWEKGRATGFLNANRMPMRSHEDIAVFYRKLPTYNPQFRDGDSHPQGNGVHKETNNCYGDFGRIESVRHKVGKTHDYDKESIKVVPPIGKCFPMSVLHFDKEHKGDTWHPTQKPVDLIRWLVRTYSNEGDTILDATMGSGTTAIACIKEHRRFVGFELNKEYYDKAVKRINEELQQPTLF